MADDSYEHGQSPSLSTALRLQEPEFPYPNAHATDHPQDVAINPPATNGARPNDIPRTMDAGFDHQNDLEHPSAPPTPKPASDGPAPSSQTIRRSATDRPRPTARRSLLGRKRAETAGKLPHVNRQVKLTLDPISSDSSSSDEDEKKATKAGDAGSQKKGTGGESRPSPFSRFKMANEHFLTKGKVSKIDGRLKLSINETINSGYFAKTLGAGLKKHFKGAEDLESTTSAVGGGTKVDKIAPEDDCMEDPHRRVKLTIVIIVIGSRGDIQPFLRVGKILKDDYGHRVRIASHPAFKEFVEEDSGLEFFSIGGDPSELMAFMVKNPGLIPSMETVKEGEIGRRRAAMYDMFQGMWRACTNSTDDEDDEANIQLMGDKYPFVCDAIIANPPSFAPPHIAERLGVPLHIMFTFPYSPTTKFPHPLANIQNSNVDAKYTNFMSYPLVEMMTWQGLGDLVNRFRTKTLHLAEVSTLWAPGQMYRLKVPYTYMWSPSLVPKPKDWGPEIDISGFVFLDLASSFEPPDDLVKFLDVGPPPIYIGFGSIVVDDPDGFTKLIFKAVELAGVRALVSKGWGGFGSNEDAPDNVFMLENTPHDWLFPKVSAVVHHGGAGTTAIGLKCGKPTMIVPFFGDQPFWGAMVSKAKAGAHECIPYKKLTAERLAEGIKQCLSDEAQACVKKIAESIMKEGDGALNAVRSFHRSLPLKESGTMRCALLPNRAAVWRLKDTSILLSPLAAELLVEWRKVKWNELRLLRHYEWNDFGGPGGPITGGWGAVVDTMSDVATGVGLVPLKMARSMKEREKYYKKYYKVKKKERRRQKTLDKANNGLQDAGATQATSSDKGTTESNSDRPRAPSYQESTLSKVSGPDNWLAQEFAQEAGHGVHKTGSAILKFPMNFMVGITQGFHNAPRLYGDETVRRPHRITGFHSGIRAGRDEFVYGISDGFTGLWTQPYRGAKEHGMLGLLEGFGLGLGGLVLKNISASLGPTAYLMKGLDEEHLKKYQPTKFLRRARIVQGRKDLDDLETKRNPDTDEEELERKAVTKRAIEHQVSEKWESLQGAIAEERKKNKSGIRAALLGRPKHKDGRPIPLKSSRSPTPPSATPAKHDSGDIARPGKATSAPINQAEHLQEANGDANDHPIKTSRRGTAPEAAIQWKEKGAKKKKHRFDALPQPEQREIKENAVPKQNAPNAFQASLEGNGHTVGSTMKAQDAEPGLKGTYTEA